jgi:nitric oxide reductase NorE protein
MSLQGIAPGKPAKHVPGEEGVWVFICGDLLVFAIFFLTFLTYRAADPALYNASHDLLNRGIGLFNTFLLLTSSLFVAQAVTEARRGGRAAPGLLLAAMACGAGFVAMKMFEYGQKLAAGITLNTNEFFIFYFMFTGIHLVHVILGLGVLVFMWSSARRADANGSCMRVLEGGGAFWHLVDLLWVILFALFYLLK